METERVTFAQRSLDCKHYQMKGFLRLLQHPELSYAACSKERTVLTSCGSCRPGQELRLLLLQALC